MPEQTAEITPYEPARIQADLKTMSALGVYGMSVITAVTAQNTCGVTGIQAITPDIVKAQLEAVFSDIACDAVKIGMLFSVETIAATIDMLDKYAPLHIVLDPVLVSTSGHRLYGDDHLVDALKAGLFPRATLITPNTEEAALLSSEKVDTPNTHGTGCTLSSAIASYLALGKELKTAIALAKQYVHEGLTAGAHVTVGHGHGPLNHLFAPLPLLAKNNTK